MHKKRDRAHRRTRRARREGHRGRQARLGEGQEAVDIASCWWEKVLEFEPTHDEALAELYKLYERNKEWDKLADICETQADCSDDRRQDPRRRAAAARPPLHREGRTSRREAIDAWQRAARRRREQPRAQDALKKLYVTQKALGRARGVLRARRQVSTSTSACSSARSRPERRAPARRSR